MNKHAQNEINVMLSWLYTDSFIPLKLQKNHKNVKVITNKLLYECKFLTLTELLMV